MEFVRCFSLVYFVFTVGNQIMVLPFSVIQILQYSHCRVLPGHYNYSVIFGVQASSLVLSTVLLIASFLLVLKNQSYGQFGIYQASQKMWTTVTSVMLFFALSLLSFSLTAFVVNGLADIEASLTQDIIKYNSNVSSEIDSIQTHFRCCGVDGPESWQLNWKYNCNSTNGVCGVPQSCCIDNFNWTCGFGVLQNETLNSSNVYKGDCQMALKKCIDVAPCILFILISVFYVAMSFPFPRKKCSSRDRWYASIFDLMKVWRLLVFCFTPKRCKRYKTTVASNQLNLYQSTTRFA
jgi:hypothetical protein